MKRRALAANIVVRTEGDGIDGTGVILKVLRSLCACLLVLILFLVCYQVFTRYVLGEATQAAEELARMSLLWTVLLGAPLIALEPGHVSVTAFRDRLPTGGQRALDIFSSFLACACSLILVEPSLHASLDVVGVTTPGAGVPRWLLFAPSLVGFSLMSLAYGSALWRLIFDAKRDVAQSSSSCDS